MGFWVLPYGVGGIWSEFCGFMARVVLWLLNVGSFHLGLQIRTHSIRKAHENIDKTLKAAEVILSHFDQYRQVGFCGNHGFTGFYC